MERMWTLTCPATNFGAFWPWVHGHLGGQLVDKESVPFPGLLLTMQGCVVSGLISRSGDAAPGVGAEAK